MRVTFVQYGDYGEAVHRFVDGGSENYYAQRYSVDFVADLQESADSVTVITLAADPYDEWLPNGVHAIGLRLWQEAEPSDVVHVVEKTDPTHLVVCTPLTPVLSWAIDAGVRTLGLFADSFECTRFRSWLRNHRLAATLNHPGMEWVGNHNVNASLSLRRIGVHPSKIIPWDWPPEFSPMDFPAKTAVTDVNCIRLLYVGYISTEKGVGDCIQAVRILRDKRLPVELTIAGNGPDLQNLIHLVSRLHLTSVVNFLGLVPHATVIQLMHEHDGVLVTSHIDCPEGLPMTIYEAYCSRTPLIASDHPMFRRKVQHETSALVYHAGVPQSLAETIQRLIESPDLYRQFSENSCDAWHALQCPVKWGDLLTHWLDNKPGDQLWLAQYTLNSYPYY